MCFRNTSGLFTDLWALGVIIYEMAVSEKTFKAKNSHDVFSMIMNMEVSYPSNMDPDIKDLIQK